MSKHTPGPWVVVPVNYKLGRNKHVSAATVVMAGEDVDRRRVADCRDEDGGEWQTDEANALVVAVAPKALELLQLAVDKCGTGDEVWLDRDWVAAALLVIKKAGVTP